MRAALTALTDRLREAQAAQVRGRRVIIFAPVLAAATKRVALYRQLGATDQLVLTLGQGTGALPDPADARVEYLAVPGGVRSVADEIEQWGRVLRTPSARVIEVVEQFDPEGDALVVNATPTATADRVFGREVSGGRSLADEALEDKTLCGPIFRRAAVATAPEEVVESTPEALQRACTRLDDGAGVVISADASQGMNGGAAKVWWVRPGTDPSEVLRAVADAGDTARVMPFLEGQPCSIHGLVTGAGTIVLRPVELCMLRPAGGTSFKQAGISTWWDPDPAAREQIRSAARSIGDVLGRDHNYRGAFGVDGILTACGFRPHELNPRFSGGISTINKGVDQVPLDLLDTMLRTGSELGADLSELEQDLLEAGDRHRFGTAYLTTAAVEPDRTTEIRVAGSPTGLVPTQDEAESVGTLELGPAAMGGLVRFTPAAFTPGQRMTPWAVAAYRLADELWQTGFGPLEAPIEFR